MGGIYGETSHTALLSRVLGLIFTGEAHKEINGLGSDMNLFRITTERKQMPFVLATPGPGESNNLSRMGGSKSLTHWRVFALKGDGNKSFN